MKNKKEVFWCKNCLNMSTRPRITFDDRGWCNACQWMEEKKVLDWSKREKELKSLQTVGYKEWFQFFDRKISLEKVSEEIKKNTRRYAKRQITWFNQLSINNLIKQKG